MSKVTSLDFARVFEYIPSDDILGYPSPTCSAFMWILMGFFFTWPLTFEIREVLDLIHCSFVTFDELPICFSTKACFSWNFWNYGDIWRSFQFLVFSSLARFLIKLNSQVFQCLQLSVSSLCLLSVYGTSIFCKTLVHLDLTLNSSIKRSSNFRLLDSSVSILQRLLVCAFF